MIGLKCHYVFASDIEEARLLVAINKGFIPVEYFGTPTLIQFENITVYGLENPHMYLKSMYSDYMELPPVEKRVSLHDNNYCDLNKSYLKD